MYSVVQLGDAIFSKFRFEHAEEIMYTKLENAETHISDLEEKLREAMGAERTMRYQLEDVEYSEVGLHVY